LPVSSSPYQSAMAVPFTTSDAEMLPIPSSPMEEVKVRWMTSNNVSCTVEVNKTCKVANLMAQVEEKAGIPVEEQNLFLGPKELLAIDTIPPLGTDDLQLVRAKSDPRNTNLASFHKYATISTLEAGTFTHVCKIGQGIGAVVFKYSWIPGGHKNSIDVAVKKVSIHTVKNVLEQEANEYKRHMKPQICVTELEDPLAEIGILQYLAAQQDVSNHLLRILDVFEDKQHLLIVTEFADGGDLFDLAAQGNPTEHDIFTFMRQAFCALAYLHEHHIGHRDVSLENLVLKKGIVKLMDFGAAVRSHSASGQVLRYFSRVGKEFYRAPECYVPHMSEVSISVPPRATSDSIAMVTVGNKLVEVRLPEGAVPGRMCDAEVWGYSVPPADIFAAGMCLFMLLFKTNAFSIATLDDPGFHQLHYKQEEGLKGMLEGWNVPVPPKNTSQLLCNLLASNPSYRPSADACLRSPCFDSSHLCDVPVEYQPLCF